MNGKPGLNDREESFGLARFAAFINVYAALVMIGIIPFIFVVPRLVRESE